MNESLYRMYMEQKNILRRAEKSEIKGLNERELIHDVIQSIEILEATNPEYKYRYDRHLKNQELLTPEQIDFICYQIGDWYLEWKDRIVVDLKEGTHRLGYAKEQLKTLICGE